MGSTNKQCNLQRRSRLVKISSVFLVLFAAIIACGPTTQLATTSLQFEPIKNALTGKQIEEPSGQWIFEITQVELVDGAIRIYGEKASNVESETGAFELRLAVQDGELLGDIFIIEGFGIDADNVRAHIVPMIIDTLVNSAAGERTVAEFVDVAVDAKMVRLTFRFLPLTTQDSP